MPKPKKKSLGRNGFRGIGAKTAKTKKVTK